jgi:predicted ABC-class ATPase
LRAVYTDAGVSTILASAGAGDFLAVADTVVRMVDFKAVDVTASAREIAHATRSMRPHDPPSKPVVPGRRSLSVSEAIGSATRVAFRAPREIRVGDDVLSLAALGGELEPAQLRTVALVLRAARDVLAGGCDLREAIARFERLLDTSLDALDGPASPELARPRGVDIAAALLRWPRLVSHRLDAAQ